MKTKDVILLVMQARVEAYLRTRYAILNADLSNDDWDFDQVASMPLPTPVWTVLKTACVCCLNEAINAGDWSSIDEMLLDEEGISHGELVTSLQEAPQ